MNFLPLTELPIFHEAYTVHTFVIDGTEHQIIAMPVRVGERQLRAEWTPEMAQDIQAYHNIDAEAELERVLTNEIRAAVDQDIFRQLIRGREYINPGYIYAPYIPAEMTPVVAEGNFIPRDRLLTRYAQRAVNPNNYQVIRIASAAFPDGIRFKLTPAMTSEGIEFFEINRMTLPKTSPKEKLRNDVLEKWVGAGLFDKFIVEELPE